MPAERYFYDSALEQGLFVQFEDQEFHHLVHVMRTRVGESIEIVNGQGQLGIGTVTNIDKKRAIIEIVSVETSQAKGQKIILAQAIPRMNRLEFILEKGTELGMTEIWLFPTSRSEKKNFTENQIQRLQGIIIAAMKQCGRLFLPQMIFKPPLKELKEIPCRGYFGDVNPDAPWFDEQWKNQDNKSHDVIFFIGPESGFTEDEEEKRLKELGCVGVKLHENILRTDTAAMTALALVTHICKKGT